MIRAPNGLDHVLDSFWKDKALPKNLGGLAIQSSLANSPRREHTLTWGSKISPKSSEGTILKAKVQSKCLRGDYYPPRALRSTPRVKGMVMKVQCSGLENSGTYRIARTRARKRN